MDTSLRVHRGVAARDGPRIVQELPEEGAEFPATAIEREDAYGAVARAPAELGAR
jgi:hypothetical protein